MAIVVSGSKTYVGSRSGTRSSASLKAGTSMSVSTPNSSRTFAILSGEAISVSARLSGCTLEISVIGNCLTGWARPPQRSANFWRQREQRYETLRELHVSFYHDGFKGGA